MDFFQQLFKRYLTRQSTLQEEELVNRWYEATGKQRRPDWMSRQLLEEKQQDAWTRINSQLGLSPTVAAPVRTSRTRTIMPVLRYLAAAVVVGLLCTGLVWWWSGRTQQEPATGIAMHIYRTETGKRHHLLLEDGTEVWLNYATVLKVPKLRSDGLREVWLDEGEAYFKVAKDASRPFIVHMDSLQTRVLGTAFNIQAYPQLPQLQVSVTEGRVQVADTRAVLDTVTGNQVLSYDRGKGQYHTSEKMMDAAGGWWNNRFVLDKADFHELALRISLKYNVVVESNNLRILQTAFTANFPQHATLEDVLTTLCTLYNTRYTIKTNVVTIH